MLSNKFEELVASFERLPGVGKKSALRFAYHVSIADPFFGLNLAHTVEEAVKGLKRCVRCGGICEDEICEICADLNRDNAKICVVESPKDIFAFERNQIYDGLYFVLDNLEAEKLENLRKMVDENDAREIIFAITPSLNSDAIMIFIEEKLQDTGVKFSKIAQGIPTGVSVDSVDMLSLMKAINGRVDI